MAEFPKDDAEGKETDVHVPKEATYRKSVNRQNQSLVIKIRRLVGEGQYRWEKQVEAVLTEPFGAPQVSKTDSFTCSFISAASAY